MNNLKNKSLIVGILVVAIVVIAGILVMSKKEVVEPTQPVDDGGVVVEDQQVDELKQVINLDDLEVEEVTYDESEYVGWKTYRNNEYGFEVRYPAKDRNGKIWSYDDKSNRDPELMGNRLVYLGYVSPDTAYGLIIDKPLNKKNITNEDVADVFGMGTRIGDNRDDKREEFKSVKYDNLKKIKLNGLDALFVEGKNGKSKFNILFVFTDSGIFPLVDHLYSQGADFQQLYSTFKFVK